MKKILKYILGKSRSEQNGPDRYIRRQTQAGFMVPLIIFLILIAGAGGAYLFTKKQISISSDADMDADALRDSMTVDDFVDTKATLDQQGQLGRPSEQRLVSAYRPSSTASTETVCINATYKYQIMIPAGWKVWATGAGEGRPATCTEGLATTILSNDFYGYDQIAKGQLNINVYPAARSNGNTIEDPILPEEDVSMVDGERLVWSNHNSTTYKTGAVTHNGYTYDFHASGKALNILPSLMASFRFMR